MLASALAVFSYTGWSAIAELGDEIENPRRNMALVTIVSFCIVTVIYCLVALVTVGVMPWTEVAKSPASVPAAAGLFLPQWAVLFTHRRRRVRCGDDDQCHHDGSAS